MGYLDLYTGFEPHPEVGFRLLRDERVQFRARVWDGFVHELMFRIPPGETGWRGIALPYHLAQDWTEAPWVDPDPRDTALQLSKLDPSELSDQARMLREFWLAMLDDVVAHGGEIWIESD